MRFLCPPNIPQFTSPIITLSTPISEDDTVNQTNNTEMEHDELTPEEEISPTISLLPDEDINKLAQIDATLEKHTQFFAQYEIMRALMDDEDNELRAKEESENNEIAQPPKTWFRIPKIIQNPGESLKNLWSRAPSWGKGKDKQCPAGGTGQIL